MVVGIAMPEVHVPLVAGLHEETDAKLLPQGRLIRAENVRFQKEGRIVQRNGFVFQNEAADIALEAENVIASANYEADRTLHFVARDVALAPAKWTQRKPGGTYTEPSVASCLSSLEAPLRTVATPTIRFSAIASDMAINNGHLFVVHNDYDAINNTDGALMFSVFARATMQLVASGVIVPFGESASSYFNPKCIALGTDVLVFYLQDDEIKLWVFDTLTLTGADVAFSTPITTVDPIPGHHASFDICPYDSTQVALCFEGIVGGISVGVFAQRVAADGTNATFLSSVAFGVEPKQVGICQFAPANTSFGIGVITDGTVLYATYTNGGAIVGSVQTIDASGDAAGAPLMGSTNELSVMMTWAREGTPAGQLGAWAFNGWAGGPAVYVPSLWPISKPFVSPEGGVLCWAVDETHTLTSEGYSARVPPGDYGTYRLIDLATLHAQDIGSGKAISEAVVAQEQALAGNWYVNEPYEQRRHTVLDTAVTDTGYTADIFITALPTLVGAATTAGKVEFVEIRSGDYVDRLMGAKINGQLFLSGARMREFDGSQLYESGLFQGPKEFTVETVSGAADFVGERHYCAIWKWIDAGGRVHRSQVSEAILYEGIGENTAALITIAQPPFSDRSANDTVTIFCEVYRTVRDGSVFFLLNPNERIVITPDLSTRLTFTDEQTDDDISDNETIYIGDGTILDNGEPPPCKYIWAGEDRIICGGLEEPSQYAFSKKIRPGDALAFPLKEETAFRGSIEGDVTGVAQLDGVWFVGSREAIWAVTGDGPNNEGLGEFTRPRKLPSDTGFLNQRAICEVPQGLLFQGRSDKMFLLPRGGGAPTWVGRTIQDTLAAFPFIACCRALPEEHIAVFQCWRFTDGDVDGDGRLLVFDTDTGEWSTDELFITEDGADREFKSVSSWSGKLLFDGLIGETAEWTDDVDGSSPTWITYAIETGDVRFFGAAGTGRVRRVHLLGEALVPNVNMLLDVSRDSGATYDTPAATWDSGNPFADDRQYDLPYVRGGSFRFRLQATTSDDEGALQPGQGIALNALSFEVFPERGLKRLQASKRA